MSVVGLLVVKPMSQMVKVRRTQHEHMSSGLHLKGDIARYSWHVANVPMSDIAVHSNT